MTSSYVQDIRPSRCPQIRCRTYQGERPSRCMTRHVSQHRERTGYSASACVDGVRATAAEGNGALSDDFGGLRLGQPVSILEP